MLPTGERSFGSFFRISRTSSGESRVSFKDILHWKRLGVDKTKKSAIIVNVKGR